MIESVKPLSILFSFGVLHLHWSGNVWSAAPMGPSGSEQSCWVPGAGSVRVTAGLMPLCPRGGSALSSGISASHAAGKPSWQVTGGSVQRIVFPSEAHFTAVLAKGAGSSHRSTGAPCIPHGGAGQRSTCQPPSSGCCPSIRVLQAAHWAPKVGRPLHPSATGGCVTDPTFPGSPVVKSPCGEDKKIVVFSYLFFPLNYLAF